jgi:hypothetical protein
MSDDNMSNDADIGNEFTVTIADEDYDKYKIDISNYSSTILGGYNTTASWGTLISTTGANGSSGSYYGNTNYAFSNITSTSANNGLHVTSNAVFDGDLTVKGVSIVDAIEKINKRLAILVPDPAKLEHFEALKRAYENYKTLEALCELPEEND